MSIKRRAAAYEGDYQLVKELLVGAVDPSEITLAAQSLRM